MHGRIRRVDDLKKGKMKYITEEFMQYRLDFLYNSQERMQSLNHYIENTLSLAEADNWTQQELFTEIFTCGWDDLVNESMC